MASATIETDPDSTPIAPFAAQSATLATIHTTPVNVPTRARSPRAHLTIHSTICIRPHGTTYISMAQTDCSVATLSPRYKKPRPTRATALEHVNGIVLLSHRFMRLLQQRSPSFRANRLRLLSPAPSSAPHQSSSSAPQTPQMTHRRQRSTTAGSRYRPWQSQ